ncbi:hypothetical protein PHABIO_119 [Pseudomonas phage Phabio]|uniref:Uncharacterized protein n=1 Tax=Pseudomonas phage Phabio TaxID=2006668 RepID=A0A1Y0STW0_9CAUD|nr:hypothetical protein MZD05_gp119 [Pseudomonas phage Phabio]ARV76750.1 hypothetical protein PHABIO_119 [Pseudomonas phage Phabio]
MSIAMLVLIVFYSIIGIKLLVRFVVSIRNKATFFTEKTTRLLTWLIVGHLIVGFFWGLIYYIKMIVVVGL